jgi:hypothetical protein
MHPAIPLAADFISQHTAPMLQVLERRSELSYGLGLARLLHQVITQTTTLVTQKQIEAILSLTRQTHEALAMNLNHYMKEQEKFNAQHLATTDPLLRAEITARTTNIDDQMASIRRDMEALHRFSANIINVCGEAGLKFVHELSVPYTTSLKIV